MEEDDQRKIQSLQDRVQRYEEEVSYLRNQKTRLEEQLDLERNNHYSTLAVLACILFCD